MTLKTLIHIVPFCAAQATVLQTRMHQFHTWRWIRGKEFDTIIVGDGKFTTIRYPLSISSDQTQTTEARNCLSLHVHSTENYEAIIYVITENIYMYMYVCLESNNNKLTCYI